MQDLRVTAPLLEQTLNPLSISAYFDTEVRHGETEN